jgi:putative ABC transport system permease protein
MEPDRLRFFLISIFSGTALCLAAMGLYGVIAHSVTQRTREIGVRTALGATYGSILSMIIRKGIMKALVGLSLGVASAIVLARLLSSMLFNVTAYDPLSIALVVSILLLTALLASYFPARRAARIDPIAALRTE